MPPVRKTKGGTPLRAQLADVIDRSRPVAERFAALGYLKRQEDKRAGLVAGRAITVTYDELSTALWDLGAEAEAQVVEHGVSAYVVDPDGTYTPA